MSQLRRKTNREFTVVIYEGDYQELCSWVLKKPNIETGGDLFGLWADKYTAVVQLVLGPGRDCRRTSVSFYQDVDYLKRVGSYLTEKEGLCHIGEWHSHHTLGLARPSGGDENTVWSNMPSYHLQRFVIFIANISSSLDKGNEAKFGCFLFELNDRNGSQRPVLQGKFRILPDKSPLRSKEMVKSGLSWRCESVNSPEELQKFSLKKGNDLEMCPRVYKSLETLKRKGKDEKKHMLSPNLKQMKTERGEAVAGDGHKAERAEKKNLSSQGGKQFEPKDTERLAKKLQEQKLDDNVEHVGAAKSVAGEKSSTMVCTDPEKSGDEDVNMRDEQMTRDEKPSVVQEHGEDKKTVEGRHDIRSQDEEAQEGRSKEREVPLELEKSEDKDHETGLQVTKDEEPPPAADVAQIRGQGGEVQKSSTESGVHLESAKSGDKDHEKTGGQATKDEGTPSAAGVAQIRGQGGEVQESSTESGAHLESAKSGDKDHEKTGGQATKDEGTPSAADAVQITEQGQDGKPTQSKTTKDTKERTPGYNTNGKRTEQKTPGTVKSKEPSKKASTSTLKASERSGTRQTVGRKASGTAGDKKGLNATTKQVNPAKKGASVVPQQQGQKLQGKLSTTVPQKPKKSGPGAAAVTQQGSTRQRQASRAAQGKKETTTAKKTNQPRPGEPDKASTRGRTRTSTRK